MHMTNFAVEMCTKFYPISYIIFRHLSAKVNEFVRNHQAACVNCRSTTDQIFIKSGKYQVINVTGRHTLVFSTQIYEKSWIRIGFTGKLASLNTSNYEQKTKLRNDRRVIQLI